MRSGVAYFIKTAWTIHTCIAILERNNMELVKDIVLIIMLAMCIVLFVIVIYGFIDLCIMEHKIRKDKWK